MTGTNAEKAHYKRIQRARRVAEGMVRVDCWIDGNEAAQLVEIAQELGTRDMATTLRRCVSIAYGTPSHQPQPTTADAR